MPELPRFQPPGEPALDLSRRTRPIYTPPPVEPRARVSTELFAAMGPANIYLMFEDFYQRLAASAVSRMFPSEPEALEEAAHKSAEFFMQLMGGPPVYSTKHGPPRMRMRHFPFEIDEAARREWLRCFNETLDVAGEKFGFPPEHQASFRTFIHDFSKWMVNVGPEHAGGERGDASEREGGDRGDQTRGEQERGA